MDATRSELEEISKLCKSVKIELAELEKEITSLTQSADDVVVLLYSRRCLELLITDICERLLERDRGTEPLKGIIEKITKEKLVPSYISTAMLNVNNNSTYGAHPKDFDKRQVRSTLIDLSTVLDWYFRDFRKSEKIEPEPVNTQEQAATEKQATKQSETPAGSSGRSPKSGGIKPLYIGIAIVAVVAVIIVVYLLFGNKTTKDIVVTTSPKDSTAVKPVKTETVVQANQNKPVETPKQEVAEKPVTNASSSVSTAKPLDLPEDLEASLKMLSDKSTYPASRTASIPILLQRFTKQARVDILDKNGYCIDSKVITDYLSWVMVSGSLYKEIKVVKKESEGNKIKLIKVEHIK